MLLTKTSVYLHSHSLVMSVWMRNVYHHTISHDPHEYCVAIKDKHVSPTSNSLPEHIPVIPSMWGKIPIFTLHRPILPPMWGLLPIQKARHSVGTNEKSYPILKSKWGTLVSSAPGIHKQKSNAATKEASHLYK